MWIIISEILMVFGAIYFCLILLGLRNPQNKEKWWTRRWMIEGVHLILIIGAWVIGIALLIKGLLKLETTMQLGYHAVGFMAAVALLVVLIKKMHIKRRLSEFAAMEAEAAKVVVMFSATDRSSEPPAPLPKAA